MQGIPAESAHRVEELLRRSRSPGPSGSQSARSARHRRARRERWTRDVVLGWLALAAAAALIAGVALTAAAEKNARQGAVEDSTSPASSVVDVGAGGDPAEALTSGVDAALAAAEWPELVPGLDALGMAALAPEWVPGNCLDVTEANVDECTFGNGAAGRTAVLLGDSVAISWLPGIREALPDWTIVTMTYHACPGPDVSVVHSDSGTRFRDDCDAHRRWAMAEVARLRPSLVVMSSVGNSIDRLASGAEGAAAEREWSEAITRTVGELAESADRVVVLADPPGGEHLGECATRFNRPSDCDSAASRDYLRRMQLEFGAVLAIAKPAVEVEYVATMPWFCSRDARCPAFVGSTPVYADRMHLTAAYSRMLAPVLRDVLAPPV